eukprot:6476882-Amphidinium_carterae.1
MSVCSTAISNRSALKGGLPALWNRLPPLSKRTALELYSGAIPSSPLHPSVAEPFKSYDYYLHTSLAVVVGASMVGTERGASKCYLSCNLGDLKFSGRNSLFGSVRGCRLMCFWMLWIHALSQFLQCGVEQDSRWLVLLFPRCLVRNIRAVAALGA